MEAPETWLEVPEAGLDLTVRARLEAQLMEVGLVYWEGSVVVKNTQGHPVGLGYLEMTGYAP